MSHTRRQFLTTALTGTMLAAPGIALADLGGGRPVRGSIHNESSFPVYQQPDGISCGPTCCAMVLRHYDVRAGIGPLKTAAGTRWFSAGSVRIGLTFPSGIRAALNRYGVSSTVGVMKRGGLSSVKSLIEKNRPPILLVRSGEYTWHYIVVVAYDATRDIYKIADPSGKKYWIRGQQLDLGWTFQGNYADGTRYQGRRCRTCGGEGRVASGWTKCGVCSGTGKISGLGFSRKCDACSGRGKWSTKGVHCVTCDGDGRETDLGRKVVESAGVSGRTLIVPNRAPGGSSRPTTTRPSSRKVQVKYTIRNDSGRTVRFTVYPSGKSYTLAAGRTFSGTSTDDGRAPRMRVHSTGKTYSLKSGAHKFWWMRSSGRVGFDMNYRS